MRPAVAALQRRVAALQRKRRQNRRAIDCGRELPRGAEIAGVSGMIEDDEGTATDDRPLGWRSAWRRPRWRYAAGAFFLGVIYTAVASLLGFEFRFGGRDATLLVGALVELSFAAFGYVIGAGVESRGRERAAAAQIRRQLEDLAAARAKLAQQEKLASLGQLASAVAHEVRNPLAILRSLVQNLEEAMVGEAAEGRETCALLLDEIDRLAHVTSALVGFARPLSLDRRPASAADIAERTRLLGGQMLRDRAVRLSLAGPLESDVVLEADSDLLCQVFLGLLENAAQASPAGEGIELGWRAVANRVEFTVSDRGEGIPEQLRERVFEPFFSTRSGGCGLGLAVARQIVEAHGGEIAVDAKVGRGARFRVRLPAGVPLGTAA